MKKKFLKFCSVLLCVVNLFSVVPVLGVEYKFFCSTSKTNNTVDIVPSKGGDELPKFNVEKSKLKKLQKAYGSFKSIPVINLSDLLLNKCLEHGLKVEKLDLNNVEKLSEKKGDDWKNALRDELNNKIAKKVGFIECKLESNDGYVRITAGNDVFKFKNTLQIQSETIYLCKEELVTIKKLIGDSSSNEIDISDVLFENLNNLSNEEINNAINKFCDKIVKITDSMKIDYKVKDGNGANNKIKNKQDAIKNKKTTQHYTYMLPLLANKFEKECKKKGNNFDFYTPFGKVNVQRPKNGDCWVSCGVEKGKYENLLIYLDDIKNKCTKLELIKIYDYLSMKYDEMVLENGEIDIGKFNRKIVQRFGDVSNSIPTDNRQKSLAAFCGVLMVAEPWRFKEGGGLSRASIRRIYKFIIDGVDNPFTIVFSDASDFLKEKGNIKKYLPQFVNVEGLGVMLDLKDGLAVFSHNSANKEWRKIEGANYISGKQQQINQLSDGDTSFESKESVYDNKFRMHFFDEDVSDDEGVEKTVIEETPDPTEEVSGSEE